MSVEDKPKEPVFPPSRMLYEMGHFGVFIFDSEDDFKIWKAEPFWRRVLRQTKYDKGHRVRP